MKNLTLLSILKIAIKHSVLLLVVAAILGGSTYTYCKYFTTPNYTATGSVLATNGAILNSNFSDDYEEGEDNQVNNNDIMASLNIYDTITDILKTSDIFKELSEKTGNKYSHQNLRSRFSVSKGDNKYSLFIYVTFNATTPEEAIYLTNEYVKLVPDYVNGFISNSLDMAFTQADTASQTYPKPISSSLLAAALGAFITFAILLIVYSLNTVIQGVEEFEEHYDIQILGTVPNFDAAKNNLTYNSYHYTTSKEE